MNRRRTLVDRLAVLLELRGMLITTIELHLQDLGVKIDECMSEGKAFLDLVKEREAYEQELEGQKGAARLIAELLDNQHKLSHEEFEYSYGCLWWPEKFL